MAEYIERESLLKQMQANFQQGSWYGCDEPTYPIVEETILEAPAADVAPVVHGRWVMRGGHFHCSICDAKEKWNCEGGTGGWSHEYKQAKTPFCPVCGAKLDKEADDAK